MSKRPHSAIDTADIIARAKAQIAEKKQKLGLKVTSATTHALPSNTLIASPAKSAPIAPSDIQKRIDAAMAASRAKQEATQKANKSSPYRLSDERDTQLSVEERLYSRGGLGVGLHPALQGDSLMLASKKSSTMSKFASTLANANKRPETSKYVPKEQRLEIARIDEDFSNPEKNPYFDPKLAGRDTSRPASRGHKALTFNVPGKFIDQANKIRQEEAMAALKARIAATARKAGLEDELSARSIQREPPPDIEWWDEPFFDVAKGEIKLDEITDQIQHPIAIAAPLDLNAPAPAAVKLTPKEVKKKRRQDREAKMKDKQDKQRLGLIPPEPPKVKLSNMHTVLAQSSVQDPTKIEREVRAQVQARRDKHEMENEARRLTKEEKAAKIERKIEEDAARGIKAAAWRVEILVNSYHRLLMDKNAQQLGLTGVVILNPRFNLVYAEGGQKQLKAFTKLMQNRIQWTEPPRSRHSASVSELPQNAVNEQEREKKDVEWENNKCTPVWEGELRIRNFRRFFFKKCEGEVEVKDALKSAETASLWNIAKAKVNEDF